MRREMTSCTHARYTTPKSLTIPIWENIENSIVQKPRLEAAVEWPRGLGRWSLMREVQSSNPRRGYIPRVTVEIPWHGVTPPGCDQWQTDR